jgi:hypothetical protein
MQGDQIAIMDHGCIQHLYNLNGPRLDAHCKCQHQNPHDP